MLKSPIIHSFCGFCSFLKPKLCPVLSSTCQQIRSTIIVRRPYPPPPPEGRFPKKFEEKEQLLCFVENTLTSPMKDLQILLLADIEGVGSCGQVVNVKKPIGRDILLQGAAVYTSPDNLHKYSALFESVAGTTLQTPTGRKTIRQLACMTLPVAMNSTEPWILEKKHIRVSFRKHGVVVPEETITLPEEPVTKPKEIQILVMVNKVDTVKVRTIVYHYHKDIDEEKQFNIFPECSVPVGTVLSPIYSFENTSRDSNLNRANVDLTIDSQQKTFSSSG